MVSNPIQRQKRVSLLAGLTVGLVIGLILCGALYWYLTSKVTVGLKSGDTVKRVMVLNKPIKSGANVTSADYIEQTVSSNVAPEDAIGGIEGVAIAKIDMTAGTVLSANMLTKADSKSTKDVRQQEYNMISLPSQLSAGDYIDIRFQLPDGTDYIVVSKKCVKNANATTVWLDMNEEEILVMTNAIVEYYIMSGSKLYATVYTEPGLQEAATPTYYPSNEVIDLINSEKETNITALASGRYSDGVKKTRSAINTQRKKYGETELENLEKNLQEEINKLKESRQAYFGVLDSAQ